MESSTSRKKIKNSVFLSITTIMKVNPITLSAESISTDELLVSPVPSQLDRYPSGGAFKNVKWCKTLSS